MNLSSGSKLKVEEYPEAGPWFPMFARFFNKIMQELYTLTSRRLTITDNMDGMVKTVELDGTWPVSFSWTATSKPVAIVAGGLFRKDGLDLDLAAAYSIDWSYLNGTVSINGTPGLTPTSSTRYYLTLVGYGG